jgi:small nuclear ribonucleoprotein E
MNNKFTVYAVGIVGIILFTVLLSLIPDSFNFFREEKSAMFVFTLVVIMIMLYEVKLAKSSFELSTCVKMSSHKIQKVMVQPINLLFRFFQKKIRVQIWLYDVVNMRLEGVVIGFDEYMNLVLDDVDEINVKTHFKKNIGRILLKGDNITLIQQAPAAT